MENTKNVDENYTFHSEKRHKKIRLRNLLRRSNGGIDNSSSLKSLNFSVKSNPF